VKKAFYGFVILVSLIGLYSIGSFAWQLRTDYQDWIKVRQWVAQKQALELRQAQQRLQASPAPTESK
jgi:hypothetical protein